MKKITFLTTLALFIPAAATICLADYKDMKDQVETVADFWVGGALVTTDSSVTSGLAEANSLPETAGRVGSNKAWEYVSSESSPSGGILFKSAPLPNRYHVEFDFNDVEDWFGDFRYSYKDWVQVRLLPRRFHHNLDNLTLFDFNPAQTNFTAPATYNTTGNDVDILDALIDDYGLTVDIDRYRLRLKTPDYPLHVYSEGEMVKREGKQQLRFLGGAGYFSGGEGRVRTSEASDVDQESTEVSLGTNAHVGPVEFDLSHASRKFENNEAMPTYDYQINNTGGTQNSVHNVIPELKADTNTFKIHTSHSGRIFASATYSKIEKANEYSNAEADNTMGYGEVFWLPTGYYSMSVKYRQQKNEASAPASVTGYNQSGVLTSYAVEPGVVSQTDTATVAMRYSQVPSTNLNFQYTNKIKEVDEVSAIEWSRPFKTTKNIYQAGFTNWAIPRVRVTGKYVHTSTDNDFYLTPLTGETSSVNNDPNHVDQGVLGFAWLISPKVAAYVNGDVTKEEGHDNRILGIDDEFLEAEALRQQYVASLNYQVSARFSITPSYTFISYEQKRDLIWENSPGASGQPLAHYIDHDYTSKQEAHSFSLSAMSKPTKALSINATIDYTITEGTYDTTSPISILAYGPSPTFTPAFFDFNAAEAAQFSNSETSEINLRLDSEYELTHNLGVGLDLRYTDWSNDSVDNPSDGTFFAAIVKVMWKMYGE